MPLKVDYVNQIPSTATKIYDILDSANNKLFEDIKISDQTVYTEEGDSFGATDINATNTQVNANTVNISDIQTILGDASIIAKFTATIPSASWTGSSAPYSKAVTVTGILSTDKPIIDLVLTGTYTTDLVMIKDWAKIYRAVTSADTITFYATEVPSADIAIQMVTI